jgi:hypothetical protein
MNDEFKRMWKEGVKAYYPGKCMETLRKTTKTSVRIADLWVDI